MLNPKTCISRTIFLNNRKKLAKTCGWKQTDRETPLEYLVDHKSFLLREIWRINHLEPKECLHHLRHRGLSSTIKETTIKWKWQIGQIDTYLNTYETFAKNERLAISLEPPQQETSSL